MRIRKYRKSDKAAVRKLIVDVWGREWLRSTRKDFENPAYETFIAEAGGEVAGGMVLYFGTYSCLVNEILVHRSRQRQGIGNALLKHALRLARKRRVQLAKAFVDVRNKPSLEMLEKAGFRKRGMLRDAYKKGDKYFFLCKLLK
jgi:L-amino acid N-acyltransferase YncA